MTSLRPQIEKLTGSIISMDPVGGGDINHAWHIKTQKSESYFLKNKKGSTLDMFESELAGLSLLRNKTEFRIPKVLDVVSSGTECGLLMEWIEPSEPDETSWQNFWQKLAHMHSVHGDKHGLAMDNYIGSLRQQNEEDESWVEFWIERRISNKLAMAVDSGAMKNEDIPLFLNLFESVRNRFKEKEFQPRLIHGDLWKGNVFFDSNGEPVLVDPAVYYGWPEMDLAFMNLFGGFSESGKNFYQPKDLELLGDDLYPLWQVYPLLVHTILFGGMYRRRLLTSVQTALELI